MLSILVCHSYFLRFDQKQRERSKPYPPLATLQVAGMLRNAGGFAKDTSPFAEFLWADYLRPHITRSQIRKAIDVALREAQGLAKSPLARYLPGWSGVTVPAAAHK